MTEQQEQLQKIVNIRRKFLRKPWDESICDFSMKRKVTVMFKNSDQDFIDTGYPSLTRAIEDQERKLGRDFISYVGEENMEVLINLL